MDVGDKLSLLSSLSMHSGIDYGAECLLHFTVLLVYMLITSVGELFIQ